MADRVAAEREDWIVEVRVSRAAEVRAERVGLLTRDVAIAIFKLLLI